jgi:ligand-binding sensor domain-containing protein
VRFSSKTLVCLGLLILSDLLAAQRFSFQRYGELQGLTDNVITDLLQDREGYIWAATYNGLYRYDGTSFRRFGEAEGVPIGWGEYLVEANDGVLWAIGEHSISKREGNTFRRFDLGPNVQVERGQPGVWLPNRSSFLLATTRGLIEIAMGRGGIGSISKQPLLGDQPVFSVNLGPDGKVWSATENGIYRFHGAAADRWGPQEGVPADSWTGMRFDQSGDLWIRSETRLLKLPRTPHH